LRLSKADVNGAAENKTLAILSERIERHYPIQGMLYLKQIKIQVNTHTLPNSLYFQTRSLGAISSRLLKRAIALASTLFRTIYS
jgi:hypothetical protein